MEKLLCSTEFTVYLVNGVR